MTEVKQNVVAQEPPDPKDVRNVPAPRTRIKVRTDVRCGDGDVQDNGGWSWTP